MGCFFKKMGFQKQRRQEAEEADPEVRYTYTLLELSETGSTWCLLNSEGDTVTLDFQGQIHICIWPNKEAALKFGELQPNDGDVPYEIKKKELFKKLQYLMDKPAYAFAVYPTRNDLWVTSTANLLNDIKGESLQLKPKSMKGL